MICKFYLQLRLPSWTPNFLLHISSMQLKMNMPKNLFLMSSTNLFVLQLCVSVNDKYIHIIRPKTLKSLLLSQTLSHPMCSPKANVCKNYIENIYRFWPLPSFYCTPNIWCKFNAIPYKDFCKILMVISFSLLLLHSSQCSI